MRLLVTGASGWIGSAVVPELLGAGHEVVGLARSDASAAALTAAGADVQRGDLDDLDLLRSAAEASDGVIHLAFKHDIAFTGDFAGAATADRTAIDTFGTALKGSDRPLVIASGVAALPTGRVSTERDRVAPDHPMRIRSLSEDAAIALAEQGVRSSSVRLAPTVHGEGDTGFVPTVVGIARAKGVSGYIGDGSNRWPAVHRSDAATLFRLAVEQAPAGTVLHGIAEEGIALHDIAEIIGRNLDVPVTSIAPDAAAEHFGWLAGVLAADIPSSSTITQELLGWQPTHQGLLADLEAYYFSS